jgi:hypothetical protein
MRCAGQAAFWGRCAGFVRAWWRWCGCGAAGAAEGEVVLELEMGGKHAGNRVRAASS